MPHASPDIGLTKPGPFLPRTAELCESIGCTLRRRPSFMAVRAPGNTAANFS
ncbi:hypothetical protein ACH4XT_39055 [Streptomyces avidinii]|uniref:hypothetical protein n=1 Tax=Streptomyces avidinii TaxID=1895 RepID=UPI0037B9ACAD